MENRVEKERTIGYTKFNHSMDQCIFCKILRKEIPNHTVYEDAETLAFLDIFPCTKGHVVVIPKIHAETVFELTEEKMQILFGSVQKVMNRMQEVMNPEGFNVGWNHGKVGGQAVPHVHIHILPRWSNDGGGSMHSIVKKESDVKVEDVAKLFSL